MALRQAGMNLDGEITMAGVPSGFVRGTFRDGQAELLFHFDGHTTDLQDKPVACRVVGSASATTYYENCMLFGRLSGEFACPTPCDERDNYIFEMRKNAASCSFR